MAGWLTDRLAEQELRERVYSKLRKLREDLRSHQDAIGELGESQAAARKSASMNNQRMADWIVHFELEIRRLEASIATLEAMVLKHEHPPSALNERVSPDFSEVFRLQELKLAELRSELKAELRDELKADLKRELQELMVFSANSKLKASPEPVINVNNADNANNITQPVPEQAPSGLSNSEKWLLGVLFNTEAPLSYAQFAERTGKSISTIRVYMNQLKSRGFVEESSLPNGVKVFGLKQDAKVRKLYNF